MAAIEAGADRIDLFVAWYADYAKVLGRKVLGRYCRASESTAPRGETVAELREFLATKIREHEQIDAALAEHYERGKAIVALGPDTVAGAIAQTLVNGQLELQQKMRTIIADFIAETRAQIEKAEGDGR
jgi:hypothetical protein